MGSLRRRSAGRHRVGPSLALRAAATAPAPPPAPATVLVRPEVVRAIAAATVAAGEDETGGPLLGTVQRSWEGGETGFIVAVLGTVMPGSSLEAGRSFVALGAEGERAASALRWWRSTTGLDLRHLGDWHRHLGSPEPSAGDRFTGRRMAAESGAPVWLTAISVGARARDEAMRADGHVARFAGAWSARDEVRFYRSRGRSGPVRIGVRLEPLAIPRLPPLPWHVAEPARFAAECRLLAAAGLTPSVETRHPGGRAGLTLRLRRDGERPRTIVTGPGYPHEPPALLDAAGRPVPLGTRWTPARFLVDLVREAS